VLTAGSVQVYDQRQNGVLGARTVGLAELAKESHCNELVKVVEERGRP
jgi:hypothetical protein